MEWRFRLLIERSLYSTLIIIYFALKLCHINIIIIAGRGILKLNLVLYAWKAEVYVYAFL